MNIGLWAQKNKSNLYIFFAIVSSLNVYFTNLMSNIPSVMAWKVSLSSLTQVVIWGLIVILFCSRRTWGQAIEMAAILLVITYMGTITGADHLLLISLYALASLDIDLNKLIRIDLIVRMAMILYASILTAANMATDVLVYRSDAMGGVTTVRHSLGFVHPNSLMVMVLYVMLEWAYLRYGRFLWWEVLVLLGVTMGYNYITNSRTSTALIFLGILGVYGLQLLNNHAPKANAVIRRGLNAVLYVWVPVVAVLDIAMMYLPKGSFLFDKLNGFLANRLDIGQFYLKQAGITMTGGQGMVNYMQGGTPMGIDSSYIYEIVFYGVPVLIAFVWIMQHAIIHMIQINKTDVAYLFALVALLAVTEAVTNNVGENIVVFGMLAFVGVNRLGSHQFNTLNEFKFLQQYGQM